MPTTRTENPTGATRLPLDWPVGAMQAFCDRWKVEELAVFGSALRTDSDVDLLVRFDTVRIAYARQPSSTS